MPVTVGNLLFGPLIALAVVGVLAVILRGFFGREGHGDRGDFGRRGRFRRGIRPGYVFDDYGLLCAAAISDDPETAVRIRSLLGEAGIRATLATGADGRVRVLVFEHELDRARRVVG